MQAQSQLVIYVYCTVHTGISGNGQSTSQDEENGSQLIHITNGKPYAGPPPARRQSVAEPSPPPHHRFVGRVRVSLLILVSDF